MGVLGGQQHFPQRVQHEPMDIDVPLRRNCKRPWEYEPCYVELKRFRRETGNGHERENAKTYEMDQKQDLSSISLSTTDRSYFLPVDKSSSTGDPSCKYISLSNKLAKNDVEYEKMLFEMHGCTMYHHQRTQLLDHIEAEF